MIFLEQIGRDILRYIFQDYVRQNKKFKLYVESKGYELNQVYESSKDKDYPIYQFVDEYEVIADYFDRWIVVETNDDNTEVVGFKIREKSGEHIETCGW